MNTVIHIQGACIQPLELGAFSLEHILDEAEVVEIHEAREHKFFRGAQNVTVQDVNGQTVVSVFDFDGAATFFIGTNFTGPRDI